MDKIKKVIKENLIWFIILIVLLLIVIVYFVINMINDKKIYNDAMLNGENIPYIPHNYGDNEYKVVTVDVYDVINSYYQKYIDKMLNDPKSAWVLLSEETKNESFNNDYREYQSYIKKNITVKTKENIVSKYRINNDGVITVIDSENYIYEINENGVWNYTISIKGQVR